METLSVGMYVRTTYGIGKITNAYIVYDDGGNLWHLSYMTDNPKIELAIYTKNKSWELFGEVQKDHRIKYEPLENNLDLVKKVYEQELEEIVCYVPVNKNHPRNASLYSNHKFIKASYSIIDILEVGDYVNGEKVLRTNCKLEYIDDDSETGVNEVSNGLELETGWIYFEHEVQSIVTKEMFDNITYRL